MNEQPYNRTSCRLCESKDLHLALSLSPTSLADDYIPAARCDEVQALHPLDLYLCTQCGFVQLQHIVPPEVLYMDYLYETKSSLGLIEHFQNYADEVLQRNHIPDDSLVVDIGSNDGALLRAFQKNGLRVLGVEPVQHIAEAAAESGVTTLPASFTKELVQTITKDYGTAAVVTINNLYANIDDLKDMTEGVRDLLAPDGVFIFESFYLADLMEHMVFDFIYHEHLSYFSVKPLDAFFHRYDMELIDIQRVPTKGGSLRYTVQRKHGPHQVSAMVDELKAYEEHLRLGHLETFQEFASEIDQAKQTCLSHLQDFKARGKTLAGYGASATTTTFLYHFGCGALLDFIADDNPAKQNSFSPGYHIPVLPSQSIYDRKPDYVLILAWRYARPIMQKHQIFKDQGGQFIIPLPDFEVM